MNHDESKAVNEYIDLTERLCNAMTHRIRTLEQRVDAAITHIDRARAHGNNEVRAELCAAIDVLRGQAGA